MPIYRFTRYIATDAIEVDADSPEQAEALIEKAGIVALAADFSHTEIEEMTPKFDGYKETTSADILGPIKDQP